MKAYKGFNKDLKCRDFQYEIGKTYKTDKTPVRCTENGFHSCENPLHVFRYYSPSTSRFCEVDVGGQIDKSNDDTKIASSKININTELNFKSMMELGFKFIFDKIKWDDKDKTQTHRDYSAAQTNGYSSAAQTHGDYSAAQTNGHSSAAQTHGKYSAAQTHGKYSAAQTNGYSSAAQTNGYSSAAQTNGYSSAAQTNGDYSAAQTHGEESIACSTGINGKASGILGNWLVLTEWKQNDNGKWTIKSVERAKVDNIHIKEDIWYTLKNGEFVECD
jgi:hypothetical protein